MKEESVEEVTVIFTPFKNISQVRELRQRLASSNELIRDNEL